MSKYAMRPMQSDANRRHDNPVQYEIVRPQENALSPKYRVASFLTADNAALIKDALDARQE